MSRLECLLPPPIVMLLVALLMWISVRSAPALMSAVGFGAPYNKTVAIGVVVIGIVIASIAAIEFKRAHTTLLPMNPDATSQLITTGIFRWSRNPIYVADVVMLIGWAVYINSMPSLALIPLFVLYINRFQIVPEERALTRRFATAYSKYQSRVRRWL